MWRITKWAQVRRTEQTPDLLLLHQLDVKGCCECYCNPAVRTTPLLWKEGGTEPKKGTFFITHHLWLARTEEENQSCSLSVLSRLTAPSTCRALWPHTRHLHQQTWDRDCSVLVISAVLSPSSLLTVMKPLKKHRLFLTGNMQTLIALIKTNPT